MSTSSQWQFFMINLWWSFSKGRKNSNIVCTIIIIFHKIQILARYIKVWIWVILFIQEFDPNVRTLQIHCFEMEEKHQDHIRNDAIEVICETKWCHYYVKRGWKLRTFLWPSPPFIIWTSKRSVNHEEVSVTFLLVLPPPPRLLLRPLLFNIPIFWAKTFFRN